jgi:hypothetical protein
MTRMIRCSALALVLVPLLATAPLAAAVKKRGASVEAPPAETSTMTLPQAHKTVESMLGASISKTSWGLDRGFVVTIHPESVRVNPGTIDWVADMSYWESQTSHVALTGSCAIDLKSIGLLNVVHVGPLKFGFKKTGEDLSEVLDGGKPPFSCKELGTYYGEAIGLLAAPNDAQTLAEALNRLRSAARGDDLAIQPDAWNDFLLKAGAWRALPAKPPLSEEVRQHRIVAEHFVQLKDFYSALQEYEAGLAVDSMWPEGHFNAGLLYAELQYYSHAIFHMNSYLALAPDAPDAQQVRDQVIIWQAEQRKASAAFAPASATSPSPSKKKQR